MNSVDFSVRALEILKELGAELPLQSIAVGENWETGSGEVVDVISPIDGSSTGVIQFCSTEKVDEAVAAATEAFHTWRTVPAPIRGQLVREIGNELRANKEQLAYLVTVDCGKIYQEALGEVQEMIDICDFAVGLSRQLYGLTIASERPMHRLTEQWHPLGPIGVISAFNFPVAVWAWNSMLALVCGDPVLWKPSEKTPLTAIGCHLIAMKAIAAFDDAPKNLIQLLIGGREIGETIAAHPGLPLISATGSSAMGKSVAAAVGARLGRPLLELGGNNAAIVAPTADLSLAVRGIIFSAVGTCGQRCTSLRRLIVHESIADELMEKLLAAYGQLSIGNPLEASTLIGPLIDEEAAEKMQAALEAARAEGGLVHGGQRLANEIGHGVYVKPALVEISKDALITHKETFAPITYVIRYSELSEAIAIQNSVRQGLSSSIFTSDVREAELFCSPAGSDCGIANVNIGTSGAEIGGAFGGEKDTGGGRESGSDAWKSYMRRATNTINYSTELPLAQGIKFDL
ncbi:aldehyde dehydrogenase family protein [Mariniblastus sp.]|nr:aldehyde dehydrogenase family protein [Mariniblastus sp.]